MGGKSLIKSWKYAPNYISLGILIKQIKDMKKFIITETRPAVAIFTYEVEAEDQNQALEMVFNGDVESIDYESEPNYDYDGNYEVEEI